VTRLREAGAGLEARKGTEHATTGA